MNFLQQAETLLSEDNYQELINFCEQNIETDENNTASYWYLGLAYLLSGEEEVAQTTWFLALAQATPDTEAKWIQELVQILTKEAERQKELNHQEISWLIRQHLREIAPNYLENVLYLLELSLEINNFSDELLQDWHLTELLTKHQPGDIDSKLLLKIIIQFLEFPSAETLKFVEACLPYIQKPAEFIYPAIKTATQIAHKYHEPKFAARLMELCLQLEPNNLDPQKHLSSFYLKAGCYQEAIQVAKDLYKRCHSLNSKLVANHELLKVLLSAGAWGEAAPVAKNHKSLLLSIFEKHQTTAQPEVVRNSIIVDTSFLPYLQDRPEEDRWFQNQVAQIFQENLQALRPDLFKQSWSNNLAKSRRLKIGYLASTLRSHSVGWLSRWLFHYSDAESCQTYLYLINQNLENPFTQNWFVEKVDTVRSFGVDTAAIATQIREDEIDILVDLDSVTLDTTCTVMALKPAPIQVTWLGWDASGLPAIDYFIADPYVLPKNAQEYYRETIWRLPQTYVAVNGFEIGIPTLRRDRLNIPEDAVVYLSSQRGFKRHPETTRLQMRILKNVDNSYFLIKGTADKETIQKFFTEIAEAEKVDPRRLIFLDIDRDEYTHRANLQIADVVLDTFPYNGATTTLETLWLGIPLVTRVGKQFAARNSYAFMTNVGVTEGIATTAEEYVEWGIRFGTDESLRQKVAWKLQKSRQTSPLWNAKQFTREMENAYRQMWQRYNS
ncbi:O-linked N-acetylglucosamine transferase, SPINDLY family protein [Oscillatoria salina]|uniref:O-linked N-acetylglucosamine transferase, SPINDLY family protein n=1 Tax=Oscillatoria salina TaxID=331517 RepID=UPI001CCF4F24|nr:O-linked N-acetylglucosamine transferase, SPINDLY family protein [Oscillatoria salina]MBZ8180324.1 O-linked N-acetylglucosamine transferase, SPINDLY family protein [Oscillatoria salina IIICB1]